MQIYSRYGYEAYLRTQAGRMSRALIGNDPQRNRVQRAVKRSYLAHLYRGIQLEGLDRRLVSPCWA